MLKTIIEEYPDETFLVMDGFDDAVLGLEEKSMRLVYSVGKVIDILMKDMSLEDAGEYYDFNIAGAHVGEKTPILLEDRFFIEQTTQQHD